MACAGACKMKALVPIDGDRPGLQFTEADCVQCGLCARVCPEQAIRLVPRLNPEPVAASPTVLHQVEPARCISCGQAFASGEMIAAILHRLKGHWMYSDPEEQRRLSMCGRCRVQDFFTRQSRGGPY